MGDRPPEDGDDLWTEVLSQVTDALNDNEIDLGVSRDDLVEGVRQALETLTDGLDIEFDVMGTVDAGPQQASVDVSVVEGGRGEADPLSPGEKPKLHVAPSVDGDDEDEALDFTHDPLIAPPPNFVTKVKVLRTSPRVLKRGALKGGAVKTARTSTTLQGLKDAGWINVATGGEPDAAWQTIYQGRTPRVYRVACTRGVLDVTLDGAQVERLRPGQSIDVEGKLVRVTAPSGGQAKGGYAQIQPKNMGEE
jgi:hypothetical protein